MLITVDLSFFDNRKDGEHGGVGFMSISKISTMLGAIFFGPISFLSPSTNIQLLALPQIFVGVLGSLIGVKN